MMIKRFLTYVSLALCACFCPSVFAMDRPASYLVASLDRMGELQATAATRLELTLAEWRAGSESADTVVSSNLRASSNHFVMASIQPLTEPGIQPT